MVEAVIIGEFVLSPNA